MSQTQVPVTDLVSCNNRQIDRYGNTILTADQFTRACLCGMDPSDGVYVTELNADIRQYNRYVDKKISTYPDSVVLPDTAFNWVIPAEYQSIKLNTYIANKLSTEVVDMSATEVDSRIQRVQLELNLVKKHQLTDLFRCLIYIIDRLTESKQVWGLGRGSSVASYVLYLIGVHDIDSVYFNIDPLEFFKSK